MTEKQYKKSIETGELQLDRRNKVDYYFSVTYFFLMAIICLFLNVWNYVQNKPAFFMGYKILFIIVPILIGICSYLLQKGRLKFQIIETSLKKEEIIKLIEELVNDQGWTISSQLDNIYTIKTNNSLLSNNWGGEQVTILLNGNTILVNSIGDTDNRQSFFSIFRNKDNVNKVLVKLGVDTGD